MACEAWITGETSSELRQIGLPHMLELKALVLSLSSALTALTALTACDYDVGRVGECGALHPMLL